MSWPDGVLKTIANSEPWEFDWPQNYSNVTISGYYIYDDIYDVSDHVYNFDDTYGFAIGAVTVTRQSGHCLVKTGEAKREYILNIEQTICLRQGKHF